MADYEYDDFTGEGYYLVHYGRAYAPEGPYRDVRELAHDRGLCAYPDMGYIVTWDQGVLGSVPSLNPDDLVEHGATCCHGRTILELADEIDQSEMYEVDQVVAWLRAKAGDKP